MPSIEFFDKEELSFEYGFFGNERFFSEEKNASPHEGSHFKPPLVLEKTFLTENHSPWRPIPHTK